MRSSGRSIIAYEEGIAGAIRDRGLGFAEGPRDGVPGPARIVLVDDRCEELARLRELIGRNTDLVVVAACRCTDGAMLAVRQYRPAVVILDVQLPGQDGVELIREITAISEAKVIVFTAALQKREIVSVLRSGVTAIVFKYQPASMLVSCVREALAEEPHLARHLTAPERPRAALCGGVEALSAREREVAEWVAVGARNKEIAWNLGISEGTVKLHLFRAYRKLRVGNRVGLVLALRRAAGDTLASITFVKLTFVSLTFV